MAHSSSAPGTGAGSPSLVGRAVLALVLTVVFYVLALAVAGALIGLPVGSIASGGGFPIFWGIAMVIAGISILVAIVPRPEKFEAPGPRVTRESQPELMGLVDEVAREVGHPLPEETYVTPEANAAVTEVGPPLLRKRRVMILGLPLLDLLTTQQLKAVIAHEFGHYVGGDTRIGTWTYRTRRAILRTVSALRWDDDDDGLFEKVIRLPFEGYAKLFLRITSAVSRKQEFAADALAVQVAGRDAHVGALRRIAAGAPAFDAYWGSEVVPALNSGLRPPLGEGFRRFLSVEAIDRAVEGGLNVALEEDAHDPYDSHPTLRQRLEAVGASPEEHVADEGEPAASLVRDHAGLEHDLIRALGGDAAAELRAASWDDVERAWLEGYERLVADFGDLLDGKTVGDMPSLARNAGDLGIRLRRRHDEIPSEDHAKALAADLIGASVVLALVRRGFEFHAGPGEPIACARGEERFEPFNDLASFARGAGSEAGDPDEYARRLAQAGVADEPLAQQDGAERRAAEPAAEPGPA